jgi:hypothetical protein
MYWFIASHVLAFVDLLLGLRVDRFVVISFGRLHVHHRGRDALILNIEKADILTAMGHMFGHFEANREVIAESLNDSTNLWLRTVLAFSSVFSTTPGPLTGVITIIGLG